jgi:hypothetical protein
MKPNLKEIVNQLFPSPRAYGNFMLMVLMVILALATGRAVKSSEGVVNYDLLEICIITCLGAMYLLNEWIKETESCKK